MFHRKSGMAIAAITSVSAVLATTNVAVASAPSEASRKAIPAGQQTTSHKNFAETAERLTPYVRHGADGTLRLDAAAARASVDRTTYRRGVAGVARINALIRSGAVPAATASTDAVDPMEVDVRPGW